MGALRQFVASLDSFVVEANEARRHACDRVSPEEYEEAQELFQQQVREMWQRMTLVSVGSSTGSISFDDQGSGDGGPGGLN